MKLSIDKTRIGIVAISLGIVLIVVGLILNELNQYKQINAMKVVVANPVVKYILVSPTATPSPVLMGKKGLGK